MKPGRCNVEGPDGCHCISPPGTHADHACPHKVWPNEAWTGLTVEEALMTPKERSEVKKKKADEIGRRARESNPTPDVLERWEKEPWVELAYRTFKQYCETHSGSFTTHDIWPLLPSPRADFRIMLVPRNRAVKQGLMEQIPSDDGAGVTVYKPDPCYTMDGDPVAANKHIKVFRSLIYRPEAKTHVLVTTPEDATALTTPLPVPGGILRDFG